MKLIITIGLPGAGKTYRAPEDCLVLSKDSIRFMLLNYGKTGNDYEPELEEVIDGVEKILFNLLLLEQKNIYLDEVNLTEEYRRYYISRAKEMGYDIELWFFANHKKAIERNKQRERTVKMSEMKRMLREMEYPTEQEKEICDVKIITR